MEFHFLSLSAHICLKCYTYNHSYIVDIADSTLEHACKEILGNIVSIGKPWGNIVIIGEPCEHWRT